MVSKLITYPLPAGQHCKFFTDSLHKAIENNMSFIRTLVFYCFYSITTITIGGLAGLGYWFLPLRRLAPLACTWNYLVIQGARYICGIRYKQVGTLPQSDPGYVVMSNHQSAWETFYLQNAFAPLSTILKQELLRLPFFGWGLRVLQPVAINRSNPIKALKQVKAEGAEKIRQGRNLLVFPEGTRMALGQSGKYARSGAEIALATNTFIVPVAHNAGYCWLNKAFIKKPGLVTVVIGEPISTENKTSKQLTIEVQQWIEAQQALIEPPANQEKLD